MSYSDVNSEEQVEKVSQQLSPSQEIAKKRIVTRLISAMNQRDQDHDEFDGMSFLENFEFNRKMANSYIPPRKNASDDSIVTGTARSKMKAIVAKIIQLNLDTTVMAFDKNSDEDAGLGFTLSNMLRKSKELDGDPEKLELRLYQLFEQGTVFIGESWTPFTTVDKKIKDISKLDPRNGFEGLDWQESTKTEYRAERILYSTTEVYLGDIRQFDIKKQPYLYTRQIMNYETAKEIFGEWSEWKYVRKGGSKLVEDGSDTIPYNNFRLYDLDQDQVEVIRYEDYPNNEYQIFINGVMMLPPGFPMFWEWDGYSIVKAVLDPISKDFAYGKSLMSEIRFDVEFLDNYLRILLHKSKYSAKPSLANNTGVTLSSKVFDPGQIIKGLDVTKLMPVIQPTGVTSPEFEMYKLIKEQIDSKTVSPAFQGAQQPGSTATEVLEMQKQAQMAISLIIFSVALMEERADWLRLHNILANWTKPIGKDVDEARGMLVEKYRTINVNGVDINGKLGTQKIEIINRIPTQQERWDFSYQALREEKQAKPVKMTRLILPILKQLKYEFFLRCNPSDRPSDALNKVLFKEKMDQAMAYFGQSINIDHFKKSWALTWGENVDQAFTPSNQQMMQMAGAQGMQGGQQGGQGDQSQEQTPAGQIPLSVSGKKKPQPRAGQGSDLGNAIRGNVGGAGAVGLVR